MKNRSSEKIKLTSINELLGVVNEESAMEIEISQIFHANNITKKDILDYANVFPDKVMRNLIESEAIFFVL